MPDGFQIDSGFFIRYNLKDRTNNVILLGKSVSTDPYLLISQLVHSMRCYDSAGWEPQAIPV